MKKPSLKIIARLTLGCLLAAIVGALVGVFLTAIPTKIAFAVVIVPVAIIAAFM